MKREINLLEFKIRHSSLVNAKIKTIRNFKITSRALRLVAPYVLMAGIGTGAFTLTGNIPFYLNNEKKVYFKVMTEFDNVGNIKVKKQYDDFEMDGNTLDNSDSVLHYYSEWEKSDDGFYSRTVQTYSIKKKSFEDIMELFKKEDLKLEDVLGKPISNFKETKNNLTEDEIQEESVIKAVIYNKDKKDYIIRKLTVEENISVSALYILTILVLEIPLSWYRRRDYFRNGGHPLYYFSCYVNSMKHEHQPLDIKSLTKELELKKAHYNSLMK